MSFIYICAYYKNDSGPKFESWSGRVGEQLTYDVVIDHFGKYIVVDFNPQFYIYIYIAAISDMSSDSRKSLARYVVIYVWPLFLTRHVSKNFTAKVIWIHIAFWFIKRRLVFFFFFFRNNRAQVWRRGNNITKNSTVIYSLSIVLLKDSARQVKKTSCLRILF